MLPNTSVSFAEISNWVAGEQSGGEGKLRVVGIEGGAEGQG